MAAKKHTTSSTKPRQSPKPRQSSAPKSTKPTKPTSTSRRRAEIQREGNRKKAREWLNAAFSAGIIAALLFFFIWPVKVAGTSMQETYKDGERLVMSRIAAYFRWIKRGDVVVCAPGDQVGERSVIKRVIALPGDRVTISDGKVLVNGSPLSEPYASPETDGSLDILLAQDEFFLLGDNRPVSRDSRSYGPVKAANIAGKIIFKR